MRFRLVANIVLAMLIVGSGLGWSEVDEEQAREQQRALEAEQAPRPARAISVNPDAAPGSASRGAQIFVGVDNASLSTYSIDPSDGTTTALFTGSEIWAAAMIPDPTPGQGVVYYVDGLELWRWPANGSPELCCDLTYQAAAVSMVGAAYNPNAGELLFTRNITTEAIYSLPAVAASCPSNCEVALDILYDTGLDLGGLAYDGATDTIYATDDGTNDGVVEIASDGTATLVVAYPGGETDIDGLAFGNGMLYLVTDQPGDIYVYDVDGGSFLAPLTNPWTSSEIFCGAAFGDGFIPVGLQSFTIE